MACCGSKQGITPLFRANLPTVWSWIKRPHNLVEVPAELVDAVLEGSD